MYRSNPSSCSKLPSVSSWPAESEWAPDVQPPHLSSPLQGPFRKNHRGRFGKSSMKYLMIIYLLIVEREPLLDQPVGKGSSPLSEDPKEVLNGNVNSKITPQPVVPTDIELDFKKKMLAPSHITADLRYTAKKNTKKKSIRS